MFRLFCITALPTAACGTVLALATRSPAVLFATTYLAYESDHCLPSSVLARSFFSWHGVGSNMQPSTFAIASRFWTVGTSLSTGSLLTFGLAQLVTPIPIKINVSNIIIFRSMSLLTTVFTTGRCVYLMCVYDDVF
jgi:hypothetical protein